VSEESLKLLIGLRDLKVANILEYSPMRGHPLVARLLAVYEAEVTLINNIIENERVVRNEAPTEHPAVD
jgi:hypothetical protein